METVLTNPGGTIVGLADTGTVAAAGTALFSVGTNKIVRLHYLSVDMTASATVGNRTVYVSVRNASGQNLWIGAISANVAATQVLGYDVAFGVQNGTPSTTVRRTLAGTANTNVQVRENCPISLIKESFYLFIDDTANIDAADATVIRITYEQYDV